jgi:transposase-like protein
MGRYSVGIVSLPRSTNNEDQPMNRIVASIVSLAEHLIAVATDPEQYRPAACPHCGYARVWRHGCYYRKADRSADGALNPVPVLRFLCGACPRTCSRLPQCIAPRRWFDWVMQQAVLLMVLSGVSVHRCARCSGRDRRTVRRWRDWLHERGEQFAFFLRSRWPELGRIAGFEAFWRNVIEEVSLQQAMTWLDRDLVVP